MSELIFVELRVKEGLSQKPEIQFFDRAKWAELESSVRGVLRSDAHWRVGVCPHFGEKDPVSSFFSKPTLGSLVLRGADWRSIVLEVLE